MDWYSLSAVQKGVTSPRTFFQALQGSPVLGRSPERSRDVPSGWGRSEGVLRLRKETGRTGEVEGKREGLSVAPARQSGADVVKRVVRKEADRRQPRVSVCEQLEKL